MTSQFADMMSLSNIFDVVLFILSSFMLISSLALELWQFSFIRDWPEIWKSEIPPAGFCQISGDWGELETPNLAEMSLMKCYWMLQNARVTAFIISELSSISVDPYSCYDFHFHFLFNYFSFLLSNINLI